MKGYRTNIETETVQNNNFRKSHSFVTLSLIVFLVVLSFSRPRSVFADGMLIEPDPYSDRWDYSNESNQQAFINYDSGLQKMIISVGFEDENSNGIVWLFPVPSDPNKVAIDVVKSLPRLSGEEISKKAKSRLDDTTKFLQMTQIYTIPFGLFSKTLGTTGTMGFDGSIGVSQGIDKNVEQDVMVYEHLEKEGITSEIVTAKTATGLYDYLKSKNLRIESGSIPVLDSYIGKEYSFIASWITPKVTALSPEEIETRLKSYFNNPSLYPGLGRVLIVLDEKFPDFENAGKEGKDPNYANWKEQYEFLEANPSIKEQLIQEIRKDFSVLEPKKIGDAYIKTTTAQKGIFVTFPTKDVYFPLLPTSVYGSKIVPATIRIIGHVSPKVFQDIESYTKIDYYVDSYAGFADDLENFYSSGDQNVSYTKIEINAPSRFLTDDLWINNQTPIKAYYSTFVAIHPVVSAIILFILSSTLAGILGGMVIFRDLRKNPVKLGFIGLSNFLTLFGLLITTVLIGTKNKNENTNSLLVEIKQKGYFWKRRVATVLFFIAVPFLVYGLFMSPSLIGELNYSIKHMRYFISDFLIPMLVTYILPISALVIGLAIKKIKTEDKNLFEQLKSFGYSSWSFQPKDKMKLVFVPIFSFSFLIISWLLVKLVGFTV